MCRTEGILHHSVKYDMSPLVDTAEVSSGDADVGSRSFLLEFVGSFFSPNKKYDILCFDWTNL